MTKNPMSAKPSFTIEEGEKVLFFDMDKTLIDFMGAPVFKGTPPALAPPEMWEPGFFETLPVMPGALWAVHAIDNLHIFDKMEVLTQPVRTSVISYAEKAACIWKWFPMLGDSINQNQNKAYLAAPGRTLIDDDKEGWGKLWEAQGGTFIWFDPSVEPRLMWQIIVDDLAGK